MSEQKAKGYVVRGKHRTGGEIAAWTIDGTVGAPEGAALFKTPGRAAGAADGLVYRDCANVRIFAVADDGTETPLLSYEEALAEIERLKQREKDIVAACERVADGGQYRADIIGAINRIRRERDSALADVARPPTPEDLTDISPAHLLALEIIAWADGSPEQSALGQKLVEMGAAAVAEAVCRAYEEGRGAELRVRPQEEARATRLDARRTAAQALIAEIGAAGPEDLEQTAERACAEIVRLRTKLAAIREEVEKALEAKRATGMSVAPPDLAGCSIGALHMLRRMVEVKP